MWNFEYKNFILHHDTLTSRAFSLQGKTLIIMLPFHPFTYKDPAADLPIHILNIKNNLLYYLKHL